MDHDREAIWAACVAGFEARREEMERIRTKLTAWQRVRLWVEELEKVKG